MVLKMLWVVIGSVGFVLSHPTSTSTSTTTVTKTSTVDSGWQDQSTIILTYTELYTYTKISSYLTTLETTTTETETVTLDTGYPTTIISYATCGSPTLATITHTISVTETDERTATTILTTVIVMEKTVTSVGQTVTAIGSAVTSTVLTKPGSITTLSYSSVQIPTRTSPRSVITTELVICDVPTNSASITPQDTGSDALWGCSPGSVCNLPKPAHCDIWAAPPDYDYLCEKEYCEPSPPFTDVTWPAGQTSSYPPTDGYFNLDPRIFGLNYSIFAVVKPYPPGKSGFRGHIRRSSLAVPAVCYAQCNNCYLEAQKIGKSSILCASGSAFESEYASCQACIVTNGNTTTSLQAVSPEFAPFISFCQAQSSQPKGSAIATSTDIERSAEVTQTMVATIIATGETVTGPLTTGLGQTVTELGQATTATRTAGVISASTVTQKGISTKVTISVVLESLGTMTRGVTATILGSTETSASPVQVTSKSPARLNPLNILLASLLVFLL